MRYRYTLTILMRHQPDGTVEVWLVYLSFISNI